MALSFRKQWEATDVGPHGPCPRVVSLLRTGVGMSGKFPSKWLVPFPTPLWVTVTPLSARALWVGAESGTGTLRNDSTETKTLLRNLSLKPQGLLSLLRAERKGVLEKKGFQGQAGNWSPKFRGWGGTSPHPRHLDSISHCRLRGLGEGETSLPTPVPRSSLGTPSPRPSPFPQTPTLSSPPPHSAPSLCPKSPAPVQSCSFLTTPGPSPWLSPTP